jgi:flavocytochrome c
LNQKTSKPDETTDGNRTYYQDHWSISSSGLFGFRNKKFGLVTVLFSILVGAALNNDGHAHHAATQVSDVVVIGAGISGLSAALEASHGGAKVTVIDMFSVFGGIGVISHGGVCLIDSPVQQSIGIEDNRELAYKDFTEWGEDANIEWVHYYINNSISEIYDWLIKMGVVFEEVWQLPGNSVPRFHNIQGRGLGLIGPIYRECIKNPNIRFIWNTEVKDLIIDDARVVGVRTRHLRTDKDQSYRAPVVILATGGFQSNLDIVRENWPKGLPFPDQLLIGSGINSTGSGIRMAQEAGADLSNMDYQWNYVTGLPDPRHPGMNRGLQAQNKSSIWVNAQGKRYVSEYDSPKKSFPILMKQEPATYWVVFDECGKYNFFLSGSDWIDFNLIQKVIFDNPDIVKTSSTIEGLAELAQLPTKALTETVRRYNEMVDKGIDEDFGRFGPGLSYKPRKIVQPPFYAIQLFPITRKSMGGIVIDMSCRVLDRLQQPIPGLYAVGELTGLAGINGKAALEGTFLGPCIITGRIAGRSVLAELDLNSKPVTRSVSISEVSKASPVKAESTNCKDCHDLASLSTELQTCYWHFNKSHRVVQEHKYQCGLCHSELDPYSEENHQVDPLVQLENCAICHGAVR